MHVRGKMWVKLLKSAASILTVVQYRTPLLRFRSELRIIYKCKISFIVLFFCILSDLAHLMISFVQAYLNNA